MFQFIQAAQDFIHGMLGSNYLQTFDSIEGIERGFKRMERRLSPRIRKRESMMEYLPLVLEELDKIEGDFLTFFPELIKYVQGINRSSTQT